MAEAYNVAITGDYNGPYSTWDTNTVSYSWTTTIYMYQIICPRCKASNWMQLDTIKECSGKKCTAKLKAVKEQPDYEVAVGE